MNEYDDREQSKAKHDILRRYLEPFAHKILSSWGSIDFIDGFSGPWQNKDTEKLSDTSIGIALSTLSRIAEDRQLSAKKIRCIFNEADKNAYGRLSSFLQIARDQYPLIDIASFQGKFADNAPKIRSSATNEFQLLFVDPTGYSGFPPSALKLFNGRSTEIIINFMRSFILRFVTGNHEDRDIALVELLGEERGRRLFGKELSIGLLETEYLSMLRDDLDYKYAGFSPIHNPDRKAIHFHLAYATNHFEGMDTLRKAEFVALNEHDRKIFERSRVKAGGDLFSKMYDQMEILGPYQECRKKHADDLPANILSEAKKHSSGICFGDFAATLQQLLYLKRTEISDAVVALSKSGEIENTWKARGGRKPNVNDLIKTK